MKKILAILCVLLLVALMGCTNQKQEKDGTNTQYTDPNDVPGFQNGDYKCDGVDRYIYVDGDWVLNMKNCPDCGYEEPVGPEPGDEECRGYDLYEYSNTGSWVLKEKNCISCGYKGPFDGDTKCEGYTQYVYDEDYGDWVFVEANCPECGYVEPKKDVGKDDGFIDWCMDCLDDWSYQYHFDGIQSALDTSSYYSMSYHAEECYYIIEGWESENSRYHPTGMYRELQMEWDEYLHDCGLSHWYIWKGSDYASNGQYTLATEYIETATDYTRKYTVHINECTRIIEEIQTLM